MIRQHAPLISKSQAIEFLACLKQAPEVWVKWFLLQVSKADTSCEIHLSMSSSVERDLYVQDAKSANSDDEVSSVSTISQPGDVEDFQKLDSSRGSAGSASRQSAPVDSTRLPMPRNERKARELIQKAGLIHETNYNRVTLKRGQTTFSIEKADVYRIPGSDQFVVFGAARELDPRLYQSLMETQQRASKMRQQIVREDIMKRRAADLEGKESTVSEDEDISAEEQDLLGVAEKDIELVMTQANVGRNRAIKALKDNKNDVVNAIMELTM